MPGTLYIVATPIGNLEDMTLRALRTLKEVELIACEDTRQTRKLLDHAGISKPLTSYHEHNEAARTVELMAKLEAGATIALVSDAGTPLVSDPGYRLVAAAIAARIPVVPIPGANAAIAALSAAGLATDAYRFCGFPPAKSAQRRKFFADLKHENCTLIFYEAPHRILEALEDIAQEMGARPVVAAREITKLHEEFLRGTAEEIRATLAARPSIRGEFTILIGKSDAPVETDISIEDAVRALQEQGVERMEAIKRVAKERGLGKREVYRLLT
ncbi:MAG TPA: 16S rRNA (cytidine(1402)-2'-O)-methyltransferase [Bryobacteraceae bacterium]|nr:16S rRNA (cytidine(1402)-2'-O)-methyltransferase [Bryobacteraceae bacterium]